MALEEQLQRPHPDASPGRQVAERQRLAQVRLDAFLDPTEDPEGRVAGRLG
jgi:hypothetical protein